MDRGGLNRVLDYEVKGQHQITLRKAFWFGITSGIGVLVVGGMTYGMTEWLGVHYILSVIISSIVAYALKFIVTAIWVFNK